MTDTVSEKMGKSARVACRQNFDYRIVAKRFVQIMDEKLRLT
jgi:hypothetical protein